MQRKLITSTRDITELRVNSPFDGDPRDVVIQMKFKSAAAEALREATTDRSGPRIAFVFNDALVSSVVWEGPYGMPTSGAQISLRGGMPIAKRLERAVRRCMPELDRAK